MTKESQEGPMWRVTTPVSSEHIKIMSLNFCTLYPVTGWIKWYDHKKINKWFPKVKAHNRYTLNFNYYFNPVVTYPHLMDSHSNCAEDTIFFLSDWRGNQAKHNRSTEVINHKFCEVLLLVFIEDKISKLKSQMQKCPWNEVSMDV